MQDDRISEIVLGCCFEVMNALGSGFLESVYKNALQIALMEKGLAVCIEKKFDVMFKNQRVGIFIPDLLEYKRLYHPAYPAHPVASLSGLVEDTSC